ncbi:unnamed protein product [Dracunculus medinensis]|uniref:ShKT domain-containing protein n=1 Tax=Dracunculus medinensis TaxID=318479 RepID=A0A0N4US61_DRAME|nr:unnamed protein product [Dracunculus medinensis]
MFLFLCLIVLPTVFGGTTVLEICNKTVGGDNKRRPTVDPNLCYDNDANACHAALGVTDGQKLLNQNKEDEDYEVHENCYKPELRDYAQRECPRTCAMCCLSKAFNCENGYYF